MDMSPVVQNVDGVGAGPAAQNTIPVFVLAGIFGATGLCLLALTCLCVTRQKRRRQAKEGKDKAATKASKKGGLQLVEHEMVEV